MSYQRQDQQQQGPPAIPFHVHMCAEVGSAGIKRNIEVKFERKPEAVSKIGDEGEIIFRQEVALKGEDPRAFAVDFIVYYDDQSSRWKPLENMEQLQEYAQLYLFQANANGNEQIREIPPPSSQATAFATASRTVHRPGVSSIDQDKVSAVFKEMDINESEQIEVSEMIHAFNAAGIDFNEETIVRLFEKSDANGDGRITWDEFCVFAELFPNTVETLYWRLRQVDVEGTSRSAAGALKTHRQEEHTIKKKLADMERERKVLESRVRQEQAIARELDPRRRYLEDEEQDLINKEFALQFHRDMVVQAEVNFSETASRFDHASQKQGSPRRARFL